MEKILLIEDDIEISNMIKDYLNSDSFSVVTACDGPTAIDTLKKDTFSLALIDLMLPHCSGMDIIKKIRETSMMPIIIVTAKDNDTDKTMAFNLGADDYVTKPFSLIELSARIRANIRRATKYNGENRLQDETLSIKGLNINLTRHTVHKGNITIDLTYTEYEILKLLASHPGKAFSKEQIYLSVWKEPYYGNENVLNAHMTRLRNKLKAGDRTETEYIKTLWGIGYKMED